MAIITHEFRAVLPIKFYVQLKQACVWNV